MSGTKLTPLGGGSVEINNVYNEVINESTGFDDPDASTLAFNDGTREFTITPTGASFVFYAFGERFEKTSVEGVVIDDVDGLWYIYYNTSGVLQASQTLWNMSTQVPVATVLWETGSGDIGDEKNNPKTDKHLPIYVIGVSSPGTFTDAQVILLHVVAGSETVELRKRLPYSIIKCGVAPTGSITFDIQVNGSSKGTANIGAAANTGDFTFTTKVTLNPGDIVKIVAPATADGTLEDVAITLEGIRV